MPRKPFGTKPTPRANASYQAQRRHVTVDPITRLEGHGKIDVFLDDKGDVERAYMQVPELRGFEVFSLGRPAEDMPQITSRICGVCPTAHHMASTKTLDDLYQIAPNVCGAQDPRAGLQHVHARGTMRCTCSSWAAPDFIVGPEAPRGGAQHSGRDWEGRRGRRQAGDQHAAAAARAHRLFRRESGAPGARAARGASARGLKKDDLAKFKELARDGVEFALWTLDVFKQIVLAKPRLREAYHLRRLHPQDLLHGNGRRAEQGQLLRREVAGGRLRREGDLQVSPRSNTSITSLSTSSRGAT